MNWGHGITAALSIFIIMILSFVWRATYHRADLVAEDYYALELAHQEKIDQMSNAENMNVQVTAELKEGHLQLHFPAEVSGRVNGKVMLFRPSDKTLDRTFNFTQDQLPAVFIPMDGLKGGAYRLQVSWTDANNKSFHVEQDLLIP